MGQKDDGDDFGKDTQFIVRGEAVEYKLIVVNHREQELFNVAVMGYRSSSAYVQRQIDHILWPMWLWH